MTTTQTPIQIGMVIRPKPLFREQDEMLVQWVGQNSNQVLVAGWCAKNRSIDGRDTLRPEYSVYSCYSYGESFQIVSGQ